MHLTAHRHASLLPLLLLLWLPCADGAKLVIKGSDTLGAKLVPQLAEAFGSVSGAETDATIEIAAEGSATGIASILDGTSDIGMLSRRLSPEEILEARARGVEPVLTEIARDALVVVVNETNPIAQLSLDDLASIFTGDVANWAALCDLPIAISAYTRNSSSGTYVAFQQLALRSRDYGPRIQKMAGNEQIAHEVSGNPGAIGYVALAYLQVPNIRAIPIDGHDMASDNYPLSRPLYLLHNSATSSARKSREFIDFALGPEGQTIVGKLNFLPARKAKL